VARVLIVGCGCRGQALARSLVAAGHAVRGTTRAAARSPAIVATGAEPYIGDPDRIGTLMDALVGVTVLCWLFGDVPDADLHGGRLRMLFEKLVDTPVRGVVYEVGTAAGEAIARDAAERWQIPVEIVGTGGARAAIDRLLGASGGG
jgi:uncharacterized protein YbjT (DUF2867 family)